MSSSIAVVDIGTTTLRVAVAEKTLPGEIHILELSQYSLNDIAMGIIIPRVNFNVLLNIVRGVTGGNAEKVFIGISSREISHQLINSYPTPSNLDAVTVDSLQAGVLSKANKKGYEELYIAKGLSEVNTQVCNYTVFYAKNEVSGLLRQRFKKDGFSVCAILPSILGSAEAVLSNEDKEQGVVLVDIGGKTTEIAIFYAGTLCRIASVPMGGDTITSDIKELCGIDWELADHVKQKYGSCIVHRTMGDDDITFSTPSAEKRIVKLRTLAEIIGSRVEEMVEAVMYEMVQSGVDDKIGNIVLSGGGALLSGMSQFFELKTGLMVRHGMPIGFSDDQIHSGCFSTFGLAKMGFDALDGKSSGVILFNS